MKLLMALVAIMVCGTLVSAQGQDYGPEGQIDLKAILVPSISRSSNSKMAAVMFVRSGPMGIIAPGAAWMKTQRR